MSLWKCAACNWSNAGKWTSCANCGISRTASHHEIQAIKEAIAQGRFQPQTVRFSSTRPSKPIPPYQLAAVVATLASCVLPILVEGWRDIAFIPIVIAAAVAFVAGVAVVIIQLTPRRGKRISRFPLEIAGSASSTVTISDPHGCLPYFGTFFITLGLITIVIAARASRAGPLPPWDLFLASLMVIAGVGAGLYVYYQSFGAGRAQLNLADRTLTITHRALPRPHHERYDLGAIQSLYLLQGKDIHGHPLFTLRMQLQDGREVPLTPFWFDEREPLASIFAMLRPVIPQGEPRVEE